jgi:hypothetical protein
VGPRHAARLAKIGIASQRHPGGLRFQSSRDGPRRHGGTEAYENQGLHSSTGDSSESRRQPITDYDTARRGDGEALAQGQWRPRTSGWAASRGEDRARIGIASQRHRIGLRFQSSCDPRAGPSGRRPPALAHGATAAHVGRRAPVVDCGCDESKRQSSTGCDTARRGDGEASAQGQWRPRTSGWAASRAPARRAGAHPLVRPVATVVP